MKETYLVKVLSKTGLTSVEHQDLISKETSSEFVSKIQPLYSSPLNMNGKIQADPASLPFVTIQSERLVNEITSKAWKL